MGNPVSAAKRSSSARRRSRQISTPETARGSPPSNESRVGQPPDVPRCGGSPERRPVLQFSSNASTSGRTMALASMPIVTA